MRRYIQDWKNGAYMQSSGAYSVDESMAGKESPGNRPLQQVSSSIGFRDQTLLYDILDPSFIYSYVRRLPSKVSYHNHCSERSPRITPEYTLAQKNLQSKALSPLHRPLNGYAPEYFYVLCKRINSIKGPGCNSQPGRQTAKS